MNRRDALMALLSLPAVASVAVAEVRPKDVIVLKCAEPLSDAERDHVLAQMKEVWPDHKCLVLYNLSIEIVRDQP